MGIEIMLQHQMTKIHREAPLSGPAIGITAIEVDDDHRQKTKTVNIRARKGIVIATGGTKEETLRQTKLVFEELRKLAP